MIQTKTVSFAHFKRENRESYQASTIKQKLKGDIISF